MQRERSVGALDAAGRGCLLREPVPALKKGQILVKVHASAISPGTELTEAKKARTAGTAAQGKPQPFGYQNAGVVAELGEGATAFKPGDRVACMGAGYAQHADYAVVPQNLCVRLPDNVSFEAGAMAHLAATALHAIRRGEPEVGENLLVVGLGLVGQMSARIGQMAGMYVMGWDTSSFRCDVARKWGIESAVALGTQDPVAQARDFTGGLGFDMSVIAFGGEGTQAITRVKKAMKLSVDGHEMGRICIVGGVTATTTWATGMGNLDVRSCARTGPGYHDAAWEHGEYAYPPCFMRWNTRSNLALVLRWMAEGRLDAASLITHRLPLNRMDEAVTLHIESPDATLGTILLMDGAG
jgi:threonine dehydrogenase-like Zn-dependent dehydrogenase